MRRVIMIHLFLSLLISSLLSSAQKVLDNALPGEKIYLHLDRPGYIQGDTIWFKAYCWFGFDQLPDTVSKVLYVDLIEPEGKISQTRKLLIQKGASNGEFALDKEIIPGKYTVRAYTRWMQNEGAGEPFYKTITINSTKEDFLVECLPRLNKQKQGDSLLVSFRFYQIDQGGEINENLNHRINYSLQIGDQQLKRGESLASNTHEQIFRSSLPKIGEKDSVALLTLSIKDEKLTFEKQFRIPLKEELDLQFFPEAGQLVCSLESKIAFKAIGSDGLSREVKGVVRDEKNDVVTTFETFHKGMGDFFLTPEKGKKYRAFIDYNHRIFSFPLPPAAEEGVAMSVSYSPGRDSAYIRVKYSPSREGEKYYVTGSSYGKIRFISTIKAAVDSSMVTLPLDILPEGISRITLLGKDFRPLGERLIYADRKKRLKVEVIPDSLSYGTRSKVTLKVKTSDQSGNPIPADLSLAVIDRDQAGSKGKVPGISAYKLLESELKGYVEDPDYYFTADSVNQKALDLLLLTQGYRRFVADTIKSKEIKFYPERSFDITGKVALRGTSEKSKNFNYSNLGLNLLCPSDNSYFDQTRPDSTGRFSFSMPLQFGRPLTLLRAYTATGKLSREKIPKEKSFMGDILLDEPIPAPIFMPPASLPEIASPAIDYIRQLQEARKSELSKITNGIKWQINLPEFTVTAKSRDKEWYTRFEDEAKKIVDMDSIDPTGRKYGNLYDLLIREFGARKCRTDDRMTESVTMPCVSPGPSFYYPIYLMNGQTYCNAGEDSFKFVSLLSDLKAFEVNEIKKILVLPPGNIAYHYADPKILNGGGPFNQVFNERKIPPGPPLTPIKQTLVVIETYSKKNFYRGDPDGIKTFIIDGLATPRLFYSPRYEGTLKNNPVYDSRATLYWNPSLLTDFKGESKVEFYTGDRRTLMQVIINGIQAGNGNTGEKKAEIKISR